MHFAERADLSADENLERNTPEIQEGWALSLLLPCFSSF
jgi:hypothetical protein